MTRSLNIMLYCAFCAVCIFVSCNDQEKQARTYLEKAEQYYTSGAYSTAKIALDSLKLLFPNELKVQQESLMLMRRIDLKEQERNLQFCDSMLIIRKQEFEEIKGNYLFEKDAEYDEQGKYLNKQQTIENRLQRSYIRAWVDEKGNMFLASVYYGSGALNHDQLKVSLPSGEFATTQKVAYDGGLNYRFTDLGMTTEVVTYSNQRDNGVIMFIKANQAQNLKAEYLGGSRNYSLRITDSDKKAVAQLVDLSIVLADIENLKKEAEKSSKRIEYLIGKL